MMVHGKFITSWHKENQGICYAKCNEMECTSVGIHCLPAAHKETLTLHRHSCCMTVIHLTMWLVLLPQAELCTFATIVNSCMCHSRLLCIFTYLVLVYSTPSPITCDDALSVLGLLGSCQHFKV